VKQSSSDCDKNGCPVAKNQNDIYKLHAEFKPIRDKNHMLAHNTSKTDFLGLNLNFNASVGPDNIFIIRHGEKIKSKTALDCNGILRSSYIPHLIETLNKKNFGINYIITSYNYASMHQEQTVALTSWLLNIPTFMYGQQFEPEKAVKELYTNKFFNGKTVLICWEHNCIQTLLPELFKIGTKAKGINNYEFVNPEGNDKMPYWHHNNFKSIYHLDSEFNFTIMEEKFNTCFKEDNDKISYDKTQHCK
jgi:hypothetical protein